METEAALFVELLRRAEVEGIPGDTAAQSILRNVAQRSVIPGISDRKENRAVTAHENIFFGVALRRRR